MTSCLAGMFQSLLAVAVAGTAAIFAQTSVPPPLLDEGRRLVAQLKLEPAADGLLFQTTGLDRSSQLMDAVVRAGHGGNATLDDWVALHRALAGQTELAMARGAFFGAIGYLTSQETDYNNLDSDYNAALKTARELLELEKEHLPGSVPLAYKTVGDDLRKLGRINEALDAYREARRLGAASGLPTADARNQGWFSALWLRIVETEIQFRDLDAARAETSQFLAAATGVNAFRVDALIASAETMVAEGRYNPAIDAIKQIHALVNDPNPMAPLNVEVSNIAGTIVTETLGPLDYAEAIATAKRIQAELSGLLLVEPLVQASLLVRRRLAGDLDGVLRQLTGDLEQSRASQDKIGQIQALEALAATYSGYNSQDNRIASLEESLELTRSLLPSGLPDNPPMAGLYFGVLDLLGSAYADAGQVSKASLMFREMEEKLGLLTRAKIRLYALRHFGAEISIGQARVLELQSKAGEASKLLLRLLAGEAGDMSFNPSFNPSFNRGAVLERLARLARDGGDVSAASGYYEQAVAAFSGQREPGRELLEHLEYARYLLTAGAAVPDSLVKARTHLDSAARQAASVNEFQARWRVEYEFGLLAERSGDAAGAIGRYQAAVSRLEEVRAGLSQQEGRQSLLDNDVVQDLYAGLAGLLTSGGHTAQAWQSIERAKARSFLELLGGRQMASADAAPELQPVDELGRQILNVKVELDSDAGPRDRTVVQTELNHLEQQFALARQQASLGKTRAGQSVALASFGLDSAQKLLPPKTTLLEYAFLRDGVTAFVVTQSGAKQLHWQVDLKELERKVRSLLPLLSGRASADAQPDRGVEARGSSRSGIANVDARLAEVSHLLIDPVEKSLRRENERLIIVPTGYLNYLPFETLKLADGRSMIDAFTISYLPSASVLQFIRARKPSLDHLFLGALGDVSVGGLDALPGTLTEVDAISKLEPGSTLLAGEDFTHDAARDALTRYDVVHFATHGEVDSNAPAFSALVTSPREHQASRLFLYEIQALKLKAGLVVLSACQTGKGRLLRGDEVAGFTRTLLLAGADTVVASLWNVNDESTAKLMEEFYRSLRAGQPAVVALRSAVLAMRKKYPHISDWAAFVITGI